MSNEVARQVNSNLYLSMLALYELAQAHRLRDFPTPFGRARGGKCPQVDSTPSHGFALQLGKGVTNPNPFKTNLLNHQVAVVRSITSSRKNTPFTKIHMPTFKSEVNDSDQSLLSSRLTPSRSDLWSKFNVESSDHPTFDLRNMLSADLSQVDQRGGEEMTLPFSTEALDDGLLQRSHHGNHIIRLDI